MKRNMSRIFYHITEKSSNRKTGPIPVLTSSFKTCPDTCPFRKNGCYAEGGPLRLHWDKITRGERGITFPDLIVALKNLSAKLTRLRRHKKIRLWQAGDMPGLNRRINCRQSFQLVKALQGFNEAFGYTHKPLEVGHNKEVIRFCNDHGVTINLSANNLYHADCLLEEKVGPVSVTLPADVPKSGIVTPGGTRVVICPAVLSDNITCATCGGKRGALCWRADRNYIVGFPAHGFKVKNASEVANGSQVEY
jgi:hypothetical protein